GPIPEPGVSAVDDGLPVAHVADQCGRRGPGVRSGHPHPGADDGVVVVVGDVGAGGAAAFGGAVGTVGGPGRDTAERARRWAGVAAQRRLGGTARGRAFDLHRRRPRHGVGHADGAAGGGRGAVADPDPRPETAGCTVAGLPHRGGRVNHVRMSCSPGTLGEPSGTPEGWIRHPSPSNGVVEATPWCCCTDSVTDDRAGAAWYLDSARSIRSSAWTFRVLGPPPPRPGTNPTTCSHWSRRSAASVNCTGWNGPTSRATPWVARSRWNWPRRAWPGRCRWSPRSVSPGVRPDGPCARSVPFHSWPRGCLCGPRNVWPTPPRPAPWPGSRCVVTLSLHG